MQNIRLSMMTLPFSCISMLLADYDQISQGQTETKITDKWLISRRSILRLGWTYLANNNRVSIGRSARIGRDEICRQCEEDSLPDGGNCRHRNRIRATRRFRCDTGSNHRHDYRTAGRLSLFSRWQFSKQIRKNEIIN